MDSKISKTRLALEKDLHGRSSAEKRDEYVIRATTCEKAARWDDAHIYWQICKEECPNFLAAWVGIGRSLLMQEKLDDAEQHYTEMTDYFPNDATALIGQARLARQRGKIIESLSLWKGIKNKFPRNIGVWNEIAETELTLDRIDEAKSTYSEMTESFPSRPAGFIGLARVALVQGNRHEALELVESICNRFPESEAAWRVLGNTLWDEGKYDEAIKAYKRVAVIAPNPQIWEKLANCYAQIGDLERSVGAVISQANCTADPETRLVTLLGLGNHLLSDKDFRRAELVFHEAIKCSPSAQLPSAFIGMAESLEGQGNETRALSVLQSAPEEILNSLDVSMKRIQLQSRSREESVDARGKFLSESVVVRNQVDQEELEKTIVRKKKLAIFCSFSPDGYIHESQQSIVSMLGDAGYAVIWIHSLAEGMEGESEMDTISNALIGSPFFIFKKNKGYDFGSWYVGYVQIQSYLDMIEELILINDSCFGPVSPFHDLVQRMAQQDCDIWGMSDSFDIQYHMQSFFILLKKHAIESRVLDEFFEQYVMPENKKDIVLKGEIDLSSRFIRRGLKIKAAYPYRDLADQWLETIDERIAHVFRKPVAGNNESLLSSLTTMSTRSDVSPAQSIIRTMNNLNTGMPTNPMHVFHDVLLEAGCPLVKKDFLLNNPLELPTHREFLSRIKADSPDIYQSVQDYAIRYGSARAV